MLALAGGLAAGALIAALLPRTETETRLIKPTARRVKDSARAAVEAARDTGSQRLDELGLNRDQGTGNDPQPPRRPKRCCPRIGDAAADAVRNKG